MKGLSAKTTWLGLIKNQLWGKVSNLLRLEDVGNHGYNNIYAVELMKEKLILKTG